MSGARPRGQIEEPDLVAAVLAGEFRAIARLLTIVENRPRHAVSYLRALFPHTGRARSIGITGAAGSGKSTLADALAGHLRASGRRIGIVAVDPSSPYTGGAILGDRIRMHSRSVDPGTFIRSMATRGELGGLARATADALLVLDAAGLETLLVETVGVGQDEVEVARIADATIVVLVPGMGDDVQAMKAGILEIADVFVCNKADRPGVERLEAELGSHLALAQRPDGWVPPVVRTVATDGAGIEACAAALGSFLEGPGAARRERRGIEGAERRLLALARDRVVDAIRGGPVARAELADLAARVARREIDPFSAADRLVHAVGLGPLEREGES